MKKNLHPLHSSDLTVRLGSFALAQDVFFVLFSSIFGLVFAFWGFFGMWGFMAGFFCCWLVGLRFFSN